MLDRLSSERQLTGTGILMHWTAARVEIQGADCNTVKHWVLARTEVQWVACSKAEAVQQVAAHAANQEAVEGTAVQQQADG